MLSLPLCYLCCLLCNPEPNIFRVVYMDVETRARQVSPGVVGWMMARHPWSRRPLGVGPAHTLDPADRGRASESGSGWDSDLGTGHIHLSPKSKVQGPRSSDHSGPKRSEANGRGGSA